MKGNESPNTEQNKKTDKIITAIRAASAVIVFGIPLVAGTAVMLGYVAAKIYKKIKHHHP